MTPGEKAGEGKEWRAETRISFSELQRAFMQVFIYLRLLPSAGLAREERGDPLLPGRPSGAPGVRWPGFPPFWGKHFSLSVE